MRLTDIIARMQELSNRLRDVILPAPYYVVAKTQVVNSNISKLLTFFDRCSHAYRQASTPILYALHKVRTDTSTRLRALAREADFAAPEFELRFYDLDMHKYSELEANLFVIENGGILKCGTMVGLELKESGFAAYQP